MRKNIESEDRRWKRHGIATLTASKRSVKVRLSGFSELEWDPHEIIGVVSEQSERMGQMTFPRWRKSLNIYGNFSFLFFILILKINRREKESNFFYLEERVNSEYERVLWTLPFSQILYSISVLFYFFLSLLFIHF